ncbi:hypothetical protein A2U01_0078537, partial [Trifolium medium]|nr:hypothetical protein [Trifolium medium]
AAARDFQMSRRFLSLYLAQRARQDFPYFVDALQCKWDVYNMLLWYVCGLPMHEIDVVVVVFIDDDVVVVIDDEIVDVCL